MDSFDKKHEMIQLLMQMLKKNAADEVGGYSQKQQLTNTPVPKGSVADLPHQKESYKAGSSPERGQIPMEGTTGGMAKGGMVDLTKEQHLMEPTSEDKYMAEGGLAGTDMSANDEPNRLLEPKAEADGNNDALANLPERPQDEEGQEESRQTLHDENIEHEDEDNNSSSFEAFFPRKKKK